MTTAKMMATAKQKTMTVKMTPICKIKKTFELVLIVGDLK